MILNHVKFFNFLKNHWQRLIVYQGVRKAVARIRCCHGNRPKDARMEKSQKYDRALQLEILNALVDAAPRHLTDSQENELINKFQDYDHFVACMLYLQMHGLVSKPFAISQTNEGVKYIFNSHTCAITHDGIDFLLDDGGLSAILHVQTIRFHDDAINALETLVSASKIPDQEKAGIVAKLRELPADAIKHLTNELISKALLAAPAALPIIQKFLQQG